MIPFVLKPKKLQRDSLVFKLALITTQLHIGFWPKRTIFAAYTQVKERLQPVSLRFSDSGQVRLAASARFVTVLCAMDRLRAI